MRLLVLAGGFGSRLKSTVTNVPKALAPIGNLPFLQLQIEHWVSQGLREFTFLLHHQADQIINFLHIQLNNLPKDCRIDWIIEPVPLDTGGSVANAVRSLDIKDTFLLTNCDTWLGGGIREMIQTCSPAMAVINLDDVGRYGQVQFDASKHITSFAEKNSASASGWINAGMCRLNATLFKNWDGKPYSLERELFPSLAKNRQLTAVLLETNFIDIGVPEDYYRFCRWISIGRQVTL